MHREVRDFIQRMKDQHPKMFDEIQSVLEAGSLDINGTPREFFKKAKYVGLDWRPGRGVDVVSLTHEYKGLDESFDLVISTEMLEHDPYWKESLARMCRLVKKSGHLLITCGGPDRHAHELHTSPKERYYDNLTLEQIVSTVLTNARFKYLQAEDDPKAKDVRVFFRRKM